MILVFDSNADSHCRLYDEGLGDLVNWPAPSITRPRSWRARRRIQVALGEYYAAKLDLSSALSQPAAGITRSRAEVLRSFKMTGDQVGMVEAHLAHAAVTNTIPSMFWMVCFVFARPDLVELLREELSPLANDGVVDLASLETRCTLLNNCYKETIRMVQQQVMFRRVLEDITIKDSQGRSFLLKKGVDVQIPSGVPHHNKAAWGEDVTTFRPERHDTKFQPDRLMEWDNDTDISGGESRLQKAAYIPYGGGKHLCPGKAFAYAEIVGLMVALIKGYEIEPMGSSLPSMQTAKPSRLNAINRPENNGKGQGVRLARRKGWENVTWSFKG